MFSFYTHEFKISLLAVSRHFPTILFRPHIWPSLCFAINSNVILRGYHKQMLSEKLWVYAGILTHEHDSCAAVTVTFKANACIHVFLFIFFKRHNTYKCTNLALLLKMLHTWRSKLFAQCRLCGTVSHHSIIIYHML